MVGRKKGQRVAMAMAIGGLLLGGLGACSQIDLTASTPSTPTVVDPLTQRDRTVLRMLYSRAPITLNPHLATGTQDFEAGRIIFEPLASANGDGELVPILAEMIPTVENGGVAVDGRSVTWTLQPDLQWADGTPLTADDVVFTYEFVSNPQVAAATAQYYEVVETVEAVDDRTVRVTFKTVNSAWQIPFTGQTGVILPRHIFTESNGANARDADANLRPVGTGPYQVMAFQPGLVTFDPNPNYRGASPAFERVDLVGGIAPYAAAREVLNQGSADFAHSLQVEVDALKELQQEGLGVVVPVFGGLVERLMLNPTDPLMETESGERSSQAAAHPFLSDVQVRRAIALAIDRDAIATDLYGFTGRPTAQLLVAPGSKVTPQPIPYEYNLEQANALLDEAGWVDTDGNGIRDRDGIEMRVTFQTAVNPVRQKTQAMVQESLRQIGIAVDIKRVRVDDFFSANPSETNSINLFYADMQAYTTGNDHPDPTIYLSWWTCEQIATQANNWQSPNNARYCNPDYDALWQAAQQELDPARRIALFQQMDALLAQDVAVVPLVHRAIANGVSKTLTGLEPTPWDTSTWDIAQWQRRPEDVEAPGPSP
ncbi:peptide ABC transporter substrate-binding protein [Leptolyngbya sp. PCC 6406]|uniref:peptide ABC transporter substrate-binding protein n=1 Tax=Leptolyngbya sp. PCC 6406 TaxID=1173264 RepID=UPI0002AC9189|nr:peptide ABC transporter substrate-binding protein [Leptolyngbya sp. PCC 6406]